jgi:hypothetical protein
VRARGKRGLVYFVPVSERVSLRDGPRWRTRQLCDLSAAPHGANHDKVFVLCDSPQYAHATGTATYRRPYYVFTWISASERWIFAPPKDRLAGHDQSRQ